MRFRAMLLLAALAAGCEKPPLPLDLSGERLMVHSVLLADRALVHVLVQRVSPRPVTDPRFPEGSVEVRPVSAAVVEMEVQGTTILLREAPEGMPPCASQFPFAVPQPEAIGPGCYVAEVPGGVEAGEEYRLRVRIGGEVVAEGTASVPRPPTVTTPQPGGRYSVVIGPVFDERPLPGILVRYTLPEEVEGIRTSLTFDSVFVNGAREPSATCNFDQFENVPVRRTAAVDSVVFIPRFLFCVRVPPQGGQQEFVPDSIHAQLTLAGFDSTYLAYDDAARQESAELGALQAGLEGALGLFAGASVTRRPVVLIPTSTAP